RGAHKLFRIVARTITGISAVNAFAAVVIGAVGSLMIIFGGGAVLAGEMTLGSLWLYVVLTGMMAAPVIQIASISTQISEAFAGLDRIRELLNMTTELEEDRNR